MASMNNTSKNKTKTTNRSGHVAYVLDDKTRLVTMALTTMLGEPKFYGDTTSEMIKLAESLCERGEGEFVAKLAVWARTKGNLRSVSHALVSVVGYKCYGDPSECDVYVPTRDAVRRIASMRGDDGTEIEATYLAMYGKPLNNSVRRGVRDAQQQMSAFSVAKYQSKNRELKLRDTLRIGHPVPRDAEASEAMGECVAGTLGMPKGWETELSERGSTKEVWDELIRENRLGTMAKLRNLRNMIQAGADIDPVLETFRSEEAVRKSRLLPFRYLSAYQELRKAGIATTKVTQALDTAMGLACANVDRLPGRTAVMIDTSGSMNSAVSRKSVTTCAEIAAVLGAMVARISDDAWVCGFSDNAYEIPMVGTSVLSDASSVKFQWGWTDMAAAFRLLDRAGVDVDRIVILSDNECNRGCRAVQSDLEQYRKKVGHGVWCHAIDLQGYGTAQTIGPKTQVIAGWSESALRFVSMAEAGFGTLVDEIEAMEL